MSVGPGQLEIQLGHLCNNRCVFCVSGQLTSRGEAPFLRVDDLRRALDDGWAAGHRKVTLLGGEPTIQPYFMDVVRHAVALGFEIVLFSNGSKPGRTNLVDDVVATGGKFEWRFSFQGATRESHERTTRRRGSFAQLLRSVDRARAHGHRVTVNMCVVAQNKDSVDRFPDLLLPRGVSQLHLDMVNPYDTGTATPAEITAMLPRYADLVPPLERMIAGFPEGFDVNIGNLPYCVAPHLAPFIHHGGERTWTITANDHGASELGAGRKKYTLKQAFKSKPDTCRRCLFDDRCTGVFDAYAERFGTAELRPVLPHDPAIDPRGPLFAQRAAHLLRAVLRRAAPPPPFDRVRLTELGPRELEIAFTSAAPTSSAAPASFVVSLVPPPDSPSPSAAFATSLFAAVVRTSTIAFDPSLAALRFLWDAALAAGALPIHPPGPDTVPPLPSSAVFFGPREASPPPVAITARLEATPEDPQSVASSIPRSVAARLGRLRARAPFGALAWSRTDAIADGVEMTFVSPSGERVIAWCTEVAGAPRAGYRVAPDDSGASHASPSDALLDGVRMLLVALGRLPEAALAQPAHGAPPPA